MPGAAAFQKRLSLAVLLPESFRGGCSFGAELLAKPDLSRKGSKAKDDRLIVDRPAAGKRSEEHTSELQSLMRISYAVFCLKKQTVCRNNSSMTTFSSRDNIPETLSQHHTSEILSLIQ